MDKNSQYSRTLPEAGWADPTGECRWCKGPVGKGRRTFCSEACVHEWKIRTDAGYLRRQAWLRDRGVCAACGLDTEALKRSMPGNRYQRSAEQIRKLADHGIKPGAIHGGEFWQADHIVEVVRGGGACGLDNIQTLCTKCHRIKTASLARQRKLERETVNQPLLETINAR